MPRPDPAFQTKAARMWTFHNEVSCGSGTSKRTFSFLKRHTDSTALTLADCGFYYSPTPRRADRVLCSGCGYTETINKTANVELILRDHFSKHSHCLLSIASAHSSIHGNTHSIEHINHYWKSSYPNLTDPLSPAAVLMRRKTFGDSFILDKNRNFRAKSMNLAEAGFIYRPDDIDDDTVLCIFCGCLISGWNALDSPMAKHQSQANMSCFFLNQYHGNLSQHERATTEPLSPEGAKSAKTKKQNTYLGVLSDLESDDALSNDNESKEINTSNRETGNIDNDTEPSQESDQSLHRSLRRRRRDSDPDAKVATTKKNAQLDVSLESSDDVAINLAKRRRTARRIAHSPVASNIQSKKAEPSDKPNDINEDVNGSFWDKSPEKFADVPGAPLPHIPLDSDSDNAMLGIDSTDTSLQLIAHANNTYSKKHRTRGTPMVQSEASSDSHLSSASETSHHQSKTESRINESLFVNTSLENETYDRSLLNSSDGDDEDALVKAPKRLKHKSKKSVGSPKSLTEAALPIGVSARDLAAPNDPPYTPSTTTSDRESQGKKESQDSAANPESKDAEKPKKRLKIKRDIPHETKRRNLSSDQELNPYDAQNVSSLEKRINKTGLVVDLSPAALHLPAAKIVLAHERKQSSKLAQAVNLRSVATMETGSERSKIPPVKSSLTTKARGALAARGHKKPNIFDMSMDLDFFSPKTSTTKSRSESRTETANSRPSSVKASHDIDTCEPKSESNPDPQDLDLTMMLDQNILDDSDQESNMQKDILAESTMNSASDPAATQSAVANESSASTAPVSENSLNTNGIVSKQSTPNPLNSNAMQSQFDESNSSILEVNKRSEQSKPDKDPDDDDSLYEDYVNDLKSIQDISLQLDSSDDNATSGKMVQNDIKKGAEEKKDAGELIEILGKEREVAEVANEKEKDSEEEKMTAKEEESVEGKELVEKEEEEEEMGTLEKLHETSVEALLAVEENLLESVEDMLVKESRKSPVDDVPIDRVNARNDAYTNERQSHGAEEIPHDTNLQGRLDDEDTSRQTSGSKLNTKSSASVGENGISSNVDASTIKEKTKQAASTGDELIREHAVDVKNITAKNSNFLQASSSLGRESHRRLANRADALTSEDHARLLDRQAHKDFDIMPESTNKSYTGKGHDRDESDSLADETVIYRRRKASHHKRPQKSRNSSSRKGKGQVHPKNPASRPGGIGAESLVAHDGEDYSSAAKSPEREIPKAEHVSLPMDSHSLSHGSAKIKSDRLSNDTRESVKLTKDEPSSRAQHPKNIAQSKPSQQPTSPQSPETSHVPQDEQTKAESERKLSGNLSEAIEASTPQTRHDANDPKLKWISLSTDPLKEMLDHMADASQLLKFLKETPHDLHDDLGELTNFIAEMPEDEENMAVEEWIQHTVENACEMIRDFTDQAIEICESEYNRAIAFVEALETTD